MSPQTADGKPPRHRSRLVRFIRNRRRLTGSIVAGLIAFVLLPSSWALATRMLVGWDFAITLFLVLVYAMMARTDVAFLRRNAVIQDEGRFSILIVTAAAAFASLAAIIVELSGAQREPKLLLFAVLTTVLSWGVVHTIFALHYAHEYYRGSKVGGMKFPDDDNPDYWDFVYFAFVIGMTAQVSDVAVTDKVVRRTATAHGIVSFGFNTALLALMINIAASAL